MSMAAAALKRKTIGGWSYDDVDENISESVARLASVIIVASCFSFALKELAHVGNPAPFLMHRFDQERKVRTLLPADRKVIVDLEFLDYIESDLRCGVCLAVPRSTMTVMDCLHRFCAECIGKALRFGSKKECPSCRGHCPSRRSLRTDREFDALIAVFHPDLDNVEEQTETELREILESQSYQTFIKSQEIGRLQQDLGRHTATSQRAAEDAGAIAPSPSMFHSFL